MLEGRLGDFSLADIFQLLTLTKKSGALHVAGATEGRVWFREGEVHFAVADVTRSPIAGRLVRAGRADDEQLAAVVAAQRDAGNGRFAAELVAAGVGDEPTVAQLVRDQIVDAVSVLMALDRGTFTFEQTPEDGDSPAVTVATDMLVAETTHRLEQWADVRARVPADDLALVMTPALPPGTDRLDLDAQQWQVLTLVDGRRTVDEVVELIGLGAFAACEVIAGLVDAGLVEVAEPDGDAATALAAMLARRDHLRRLEAAELGAAPAPSRPVAPSAAEPTEPPADPEAATASEPATASDMTAAPELAPTGESEEATPGQRTQTAEPSPTAESEAVAPAQPTRAAGAAATPGAEPKRPAAVQSLDDAEPVDRAEAARELASLGLDDDAPPRPSRPGEKGDRSYTRDEDVNRGLLLRLIDGVKGA